MLYQELDSSYKNIFKVTLPILLVTLTSSCMIVTDRLILARTSVIAMNAVGISSNFVLIFTYFFNCLVSFNEIFVGQLNGDKQYDKLAKPVWQMIYFTLTSIIVFLPLSYFSEVVNFLPAAFRQDGIVYQKILFSFSFFSPLSVAISGFFIGQGKSSTVSIAVISACLINLVLDIWFVYFLNWGVRGAAFATAISYIFETLFLGVIFFSRNNRKYFKIFSKYNYQLDLKLILKIIKIAFPTAIGVSLILLSRWSIQLIVGKLPVIQSTIYNLGLSFYLFLVFIADALNRAIASIAANMIGKNDLNSIKTTFRRFLFIILTFFSILGLVFYLFATPILNWVLSLHSDLINFRTEIIITFILVYFSTMLEAYFNVIWGILTAGGDTKFPVIIDLISLLLVVVIPSFVLLKIGYLSASTTIYKLFGIWAITCTILFYSRYRSLKWYRLLL